jgi:hypothetical protein
MLRIYDESIAESNVCICTQPVHRSLTIIQNSIYPSCSSTEEELLLLQAMTATIYLHTNKSLSHSVEKMQI